jgi:predicted anti-sigma-YlaC factor YlaD
LLIGVKTGVRTSCEHARERLSLQLDDELSAHEATLLDRHLGRCGSCAAFASEVREYTQLLRATPLEPAPPVWLHQRPAARHVAARVAAVTAAAAAAVLVAVSTVPLGNGHSAATASVGFGFWPTGLRGDANLGVQHVALAPRTPSAPGGPRRGILSA